MRLFAVWIALPAFGFLIAGRSSGNRQKDVILTLALLGFLGWFAACGGSSGGSGVGGTPVPPVPPSPPQQSKSYTITVVGTSRAISQSATTSSRHASDNDLGSASMSQLCGLYRTLVEECEVITVSTVSANLAALGITFEYTRGARGQRRWFRCPTCGRRMFKLYRPPHSTNFACRQCHDLTYRCVQEHDSRLDWLVNTPDWLILHYIYHGKGPWPLLAIRAGYVKLGLMAKY